MSEAKPVTLDDTVNEVVRRHPAARQVLASHGLDLCCGGVHPLAMAAQAHGVDAQALLAELNAALGSDAPGWALGACREVDVRDELKRGLEPFPKIMAAVARLEPGEVLKLRAIFEPQPLYKVLGSQGFEHWTRRDAADDWAVFFRKRG